MKGLNLSEEYYRAFGSGMITEKFPNHKDRIAAGLVGLGSECFGFDDALSRDHDWGPGFCLWLEKNDYEQIGASLQRAYEALPQQFMGFERKKSRWGDSRVGVLHTAAFYASFIGLPHAPQSPEKWLTIPETNLAACTNGRVFSDPLGAFSAIRQAIANHYPKDVRLKKIAARCMLAAQSGQYNYTRCLRRNAVFPAFQALMRFCEEVLHLVFLLNRRYMPFYKWACKAAESLPVLGSYISKAVEDLVRGDLTRSKGDGIETICSRLIETLKAQGLSDSRSDFLLDHGPRVHALIEDEAVKRLDLWWPGA
ncbi:MAG: DUF4037 domain-containing protein [Desulfobacterales bacterium]|jgi:hypothetical protein|nr:DUF4037 domain-containing protein [Desulfobacterales bacterium]